MAFPLALLAYLADGQSHSGEELGEHLGVSRAAIWKQIKQLRDHGIQVDAVAGEGYSLDAPMELLDIETLKKVLQKHYPHIDVHYEPVMDSTNQFLRNYLDCNELDHPFVTLTEFQQQGRGRRGRSWLSGFAEGLLLSVAMRINCSAAELGGLSLACGVAASDALRIEGVGGVKLKWPNDLLLDDSKLGGILIELSGETEGPCDVIVGLGLNVGAAPAASEIDQSAASLSEVSRNRVVQQVVEALLLVLSSYAERGFGPWQQQWQRLNAHADKDVVIKRGGGDLHGICRGVDEQGALLLETEQGNEKVYAGDVSLRSAM